MGFYIRKAINFGGVRFNLSKGGIGASVGVKGFRLGTNKRGNYIHMGRYGLYYRQTLGGGKNATQTQQSTPRVPINNQNSLGETYEIDSAATALLTDSSSQDVVNEINSNLKKFPIWPLFLMPILISSCLQSTAYKTLISNNLCVWGFILAIICYFTLDKYRKTTLLVYDINEDTEKEIQSFYDAFEILKKSKKVWHIFEATKVLDKKYNAGAGKTIKRKAIDIKFGKPKFIKTNVKVPTIPVGKQTLYFFPDKVFVWEKKKVAAISYENMDIVCSHVTFIEEEKVPKDTEILGYTWQYVNKKGGQDKRFSGNKQIPKCNYTKILFSSNTGLNELIHASNPTVSTEFAARFENYKNSELLKIKNS